MSRLQLVALWSVRVTGAATCLFVAAAIVLNWLAVFRPELYSPDLSGGDPRLDHPAIWYPGAALLVVSALAGGLAGRRLRSLWRAAAAALAVTVCLTALLALWYRGLTAGWPTADTVLSSLWPTYLLGYAGGWGLTIARGYGW